MDNLLRLRPLEHAEDRKQRPNDRFFSKYVGRIAIKRFTTRNILRFSELKTLLCELIEELVGWKVAVVLSVLVVSEDKGWRGSEELRKAGKLE